MHTKNYILLLLSLIILSGCMGNATNGKRKAKNSSNSTTDKTTNSPTFTSSQALYWFTTQSIQGTLQVASSNDTVVYLRGSYIHNYLKATNTEGIVNGDSTNPYCIYIKLADSTCDKNALRVRAVPMKVNDVINNTVERIFKISLANNAENNSGCGYGTIDGNTPSTSAYQAKDVCVNKLASLSVTSSEMTLFQLKNISTTPVLTAINQETVPLNNLKLKIDLTNTPTVDETSCSIASCNTKGYDCCVNGQCVNNATVKSGNFSNTPEFLQAKQDVANNPLNFLKYPQYYNICTNQTYDPPKTDDGNNTTNKTAAQLRVEKYIEDYTCIYNVEEKEIADYAQCKISTAPIGTEANYKAVKAKLALACGCPTEYDEITREIKCPNWGIRPIYSSSAQSLTNIVDFYCYNPPPASQGDAIINAKIDVSSRSAPHRYYDKNGDNYDDVTKSNVAITQEGNEFYYADNANKAYPVSGEYNVNAILGSMNISLTGTRPAQMVKVTNGQTYILGTVSGTYTPCPTCVKDSWLNLFSAHPATTNGTGLRATGYTTTRDELKANTFYGNYEDTKFGRACYVPVTMLPFSHLKNLDLKTQRQTRLQTQSALYVNGYQRDWFGFNKGSLIGSFDGVKWFAIGTGRRITATTDKLYLAINDSYLDLAASTNHVVSIKTDASGNSVSDYDYDPTRSLVDAYQNQGATCQKYHQCKADSDCVTQLGWEYTCVDVSTIKSNWPIFDGLANEISNQEAPSLLVEILSNQISLGESTKRCVYRGAGAPCVKNLESLEDSNNINAKYLTCAPNFYCAGATAGAFNTEVARSANDLDNILFGMDTNILGRPLNYVTATGYLSNSIINNLRYNGSGEIFNLTNDQTADLGMCRPGKRLVAISGDADSLGHTDKDTSLRTDYINQISSCNSGALSYNRTAQCPEFDADGNYVQLKQPDLSPTLLSQSLINRYTQNMCGKESVNASLGNKSAFDLIEALSLNLAGSISGKTLVRDACLRRAGAVCFTDLDCGPNKLHAAEAVSLGLAYFGNTDAEQKFWTENLVCGQGGTVPTLNSTDYLKYDLTQNRCCREIGKDFTMYTQGPAALAPSNAGNGVNLVTDRLAAENPAATGRYSRYTSSTTLVNHLRNNAAAVNENPTPKVSVATSPNPNQWKVINETGSSNCCGGGWVRKFNDNTNNWSVTNRFSIDPANFSCLNYRSPLMKAAYNNFVADLISKEAFTYDSAYFCYYLGNNGCVQIPWPEVSEYEITPPHAYEPSSSSVIWGGVTYAGYSPYPQTGFTRLDTTPTNDPKNSTDYGYRLNPDAPFIPVAYKFTQWNFDLGLYNGTANATPDIFFLDKDLDYGVSMYLPSYIQYDKNGATSIAKLPSVRKIFIKYYKNSNLLKVEDITALTATDALCKNVALTDPNPLNPDGSTSKTPIHEIEAGTSARWCVTHQPAVQNRPLLHVKANTSAGAGNDWTYAGIVIEFAPLENMLGKKTATPGNMYYYLNKLGRFELLGIPQITYEPLYCNDDHDKVVPGLFNSALATRANFAAKSTYSGLMSSYTDHDVDANFGNYEKKFVYQNDVTQAHPAVFSDSNFKCCTPLGKTTASMGNCCSGYGVQQNGQTQYTCALPNGTDLNVYFNKFVSSEGVGENEPEGGLITQSANEEEVDFDQYTGEPKLRATTLQKLLALGQAYCASGIVANGGAFGRFDPQPNTGNFVTIGSSSGEITRPMSIVDSPSDVADGAGKNYFSSGKKWDHHYYCASE